MLRFTNLIPVNAPKGSYQPISSNCLLGNKREIFGLLKTMDAFTSVLAWWGPCASICNCQVHSALWLPSVSVFTTYQANSGRQLHPLKQSSFYGHTCRMSPIYFHAHVINITQTSGNTDLGGESCGYGSAVSPRLGLCSSWWLCELQHMI